MAPDRRPRARRKPPAAGVPAVRTGPSSDDAHEMVFFRRHADDDASERTLGRDFLKACPTEVRATMRVVLAEVAAAPPERFAGGGYWEAMKGDMSGWFEVRVDGPRRHQYRLSACSAGSTTGPRAWTSRCWSSSTAETSDSEPCRPNGTIARSASSAGSISRELGDRYRFLLHITNKIFPAIDK